MNKVGIQKTILLALSISYIPLVSMQAFSEYGPTCSGGLSRCPSDASTVGAKVLIVYDSNNSNYTSGQTSEDIANYYYDNRPGFKNNAAKLGISLPYLAESYGLSDFNTYIQSYIQSYLSSHTGIHYVVLMYGMPTRVDDGTYFGGNMASAAYRISTGTTSTSSALITYGGSTVHTYEYYRGRMDASLTPGNSYYDDMGEIPFDKSSSNYTNVYYNTHVLVTHMNMGSYAATHAYIDKLIAAYDQMPKPSTILSGTPTINQGDKYYFDDAQVYLLWNDASNYCPSSPYYATTLWYYCQAYMAKSGVLGGGASSSDVVYANGSNYSDHLLTNPNPLGYYSWATHAGLSWNYVFNEVNFAPTSSSLSSWYVMGTVESFNGQLGSGGAGQENYSKFYDANAFGGSNYSATPVGVIANAEEPTLSASSYYPGTKGQPDPQRFFKMWEEGYPFIEAAWASRRGPTSTIFGDPLVSRGHVLPPTSTYSGWSSYTVTTKTDNVDTQTVTLTVKDDTNTVIQGATVGLGWSGPAGSTFTIPSFVTDSSGHISVTVKSPQFGEGVLQVYTPEYFTNGLQFVDLLFPSMVAVSVPYYYSGNFLPGETNDITINLTNTSSTVNATSLSFSDVDSPYSRNGGSCSTSLTHGSSCSYILRFTSPGHGTYNTDLTTTYSNGTATQSVTKSFTEIGVDPGEGGDDS